MIAREWKCLCPQDTAEGFLGHLRATGVAEAEATPGYAGHRILSRPAPDGRAGMVEFTLLTFWDSLESVRAFAGKDMDRAVLYPGDEAFRIVPDERVRHYESLESCGG